MKQRRPDRGEKGFAVLEMGRMLMIFFFFDTDTKGLLGGVPVLDNVFDLFAN